MPMNLWIPDGEGKPQQVSGGGRVERGWSGMGERWVEQGSDRGGEEDESGPGQDWWQRCTLKPDPSPRSEPAARINPDLLQ